MDDRGSRRCSAGAMRPRSPPTGRNCTASKGARFRGDDKEVVFVRERIPSGWSEPRMLPAVINGLPGIHWGVSKDREWTLYFSAGDRICFSLRKDGEYGEPVIIESLKEDAEERPVVLFKKKNGSWTEAIDLAERIGAKHGLCPVITADGRYLFFLSMIDGIYAPYWPDASFIGELKKTALKDRLRRAPTKPGTEGEVMGDTGLEPVTSPVCRKHAENVKRRKHWK
jgi:hypothetical protein